MAAPSGNKDLYAPVHPVRFVTAAALFDGHDAAINIMRRILQVQGAEVVHLGHDRSVAAVVDAVLEEDAQGVAISSYQGGHVEYFEYLAESLDRAGAGHVKIYGGGGGVIVPEEIARLTRAGVRIFSPEDGQRLGLPGMINELIRDCDTDLASQPPRLVVKNSRVEVDPSASSDQVMEVVGKVAVKIGLFLRWRIWEWQWENMA